MHRLRLPFYLLISLALLLAIGALLRRDRARAGDEPWLQWLDTLAGYHVIEASLFVSIAAIALALRGRWALPVAALAAFYGLCLGLWLALEQLPGPGLHYITVRGRFIDGGPPIGPIVTVVVSVVAAIGLMTAARRVGSSHSRVMPVLALGLFIVGWYASPWQAPLSALYHAHQAGPRINEVMASNSRTVVDDNRFFEDWVEIYNPGSRTISLEGWALSDDPDEPFKWIFPRGAVMPQRGRLLVWASRQDRTNPTRPLHTNFAIDRDGETLVLTSPLGLEIDRLDPVAMDRNVSFGYPGDSTGRRAYFAVPTPGGPNVDYSGYLPDAEVIATPSSTTFFEKLEVALDGAGKGQTIHYTTDDSEPTPSSPTYSGPLGISETATLKARVFNAGGEAGPLMERRYLKVSKELAGRRSNLPMVVIDTPGKPWRKLAFPRGKPRFPGYVFVFDTDAEDVSAIARAPDMVSPQGSRFRGKSTLNAHKKPFSLQFADDENRSEARPFLGMPANTNWAFYPGYLIEHTFMRNALAFDLSRAAGRYAPRHRFVEVYLTVGGRTTLEPPHYAGVYDIMETLELGNGRIPGELVDESAKPPPGDIDVHADGPWTGAYLIKMDYLGSDEFAWPTKFANISDGTGMALEEPKLRNLDGGPYGDRESASESSGQVRYIKAWIRAFEETLEQDDNSGFATREYLEFIDAGSWVDYLLINAFMENRDSLSLSAYYVKQRNGPLRAGPVWDFDRSTGTGGARDYWDTWDIDVDRGPLLRRHWWNRLVADPDFRQAFYDRWAELRRTVFSDQQLGARIDRMRDQLDAPDSSYGSAVERDFQRWPERERVGSFRDEVSRLRHWLLKRADWMDRRDLDGGLLPDPPRISAIDGEGNRLVQLTAEPGLGIYYTTDGTDPRGTGGVPAGTLYEAPFDPPAGAVVTARTATAEEQWSTPVRWTAAGKLEKKRGQTTF